MKLSRGMVLLGAANLGVVVVVVALGARAQPKPAVTTPVAVTTTVPRYERLRPAHLPVFAALPGACAEGDELLLSKPNGTYGLEVCVLQSSRGPCVQTQTVDSITCIPSERCVMLGGTPGQPDPLFCGIAALPSAGSGVPCTLQVTVCAKYQTLTAGTWQEVWSSR